MKIVLILPHDSRYRYKKGSFARSLLYPPLTLTVLAGLVPKGLEAEVRIIDEGVELLDENLEADLIGISALTATAPRAYELAARFRSRGIPVVIGGVHPTALPDEAAQHADTVVIGMAEDTWPQLLRDFVAGKMKARYQSNGVLELAGQPLPRRDLLKKNAYLTMNTVMATRGCPNRCRFCSVSIVESGHYYKRPIQDVVREVRSLKGGRIIFLDPNLNGDEGYAITLFQALTPLNIKWAGLMTTKVMANRKLLDAAIKSGCKGLLFGFESISQEALNSESKGFNAVRDYRDMVRRLHDQGVSVLGCFMFGFDSDDEDIFDRTVEFVDRSEIDVLRYGIYTPFPGTEVFEEMSKSKRIIERDWSKYDHEHIVFEPLKMSPEKLQRGYARAWRETYRLGAIVRRMARTDLRRWDTLIYNFGFRQHALKADAMRS